MKKLIECWKNKEYVIIKLEVILWISFGVVNNTPVVNYGAKTNGLAVAGFVTGLSSLLINFVGLVGLVATILSAVGLTKTGPGKDKGRGMAVAGLILGIISVIYGFFQIIYYSSWYF